MGAKKRFSIAYRVVGTGTGFLKNLKKGDKINFVGPLGNSIPETEKAIKAVKNHPPITANTPEIR